MDILSPNFPQGKLSPQQLEKFGKRFWRKVDKTGDCWLWMGRLAHGYGTISITPTKHQIFILLAHRVAWELTHGKIPDGLLICHRCNNPQCVNPDHLYPGTPQDNANDRVAAGRHTAGARVTSKLTEQQAREIREKYRRGYTSMRFLGRQYGVSHETVRLIVSNQAWKSA